MENKFSVPSSQNVSEAVLDNHTRGYLQRLVDHKIVVSSTFSINNTNENGKHTLNDSLNKFSLKK